MKSLKMNEETDGLSTSIGSDPGDVVDRVVLTPYSTRKPSRFVGHGFERRDPD